MVSCTYEKYVSSHSAYGCHLPVAQETEIVFCGIGTTATTSEHEVPCWYALGGCEEKSPVQTVYDPVPAVAAELQVTLQLVPVANWPPHDVGALPPGAIIHQPLCMPVGVVVETE